jgi:site-specific recombinase XerD
MQEARPHLPEEDVRPEEVRRPRPALPEATRWRYLLPTPKGKSKLTLQCPPQLLHVLGAHRKTQTAERLAAGAAWQDHDLVFCRPDGRPIERADDWRDWKDLLRAAGVRAVRVHDGRHTAGTLLIEQGVHLRTVQEILGHSRITVTEKYTHVASPMARDAAERMDRALWGRAT